MGGTAVRSKPQWVELVSPVNEGSENPNVLTPLSLYKERWLRKAERGVEASVYDGLSISLSTSNSTLSWKKQQQ